MKSLVFADLLSKGARIQIALNRNIEITKGDWVELVGTCFKTKKGEPTVSVKTLSARAPWIADVAYGQSAAGGSLAGFYPGSYERTRAAYRTRALMRRFLTQLNFEEVQTPILLRRYNGGRSFPVTSRYLNETLGFNRGTMEEMMQALVGMGYDRIFQIGSVFRSSKEHTFLEGYLTGTDYESGLDLVRRLCTYVATNMRWPSAPAEVDTIEHLANDRWETIHYIQACSEKFGLDPVKLLSLCLERGIVQKRMSAETLADAIAAKLTESYTVPLIISHFPIWSSPLYAESVNTTFASLQRSRMYLPGQASGFDVGVQENNFERFKIRESLQKAHWSVLEPRDSGDDSDLKVVLSGGVPQMFGFGLSPDRLSSLWVAGATIAPY